MRLIAGKIVSGYGAADLHLNITKDLCAFIANSAFDDLPADAVQAGKRGLLDWIGCALAGSPHPTIGKLLDVLRDAGGGGNSTVFGRGLKLGLLEAPIANGQMGHILDYDDTHMGGVVLHTSSPVLSALFALVERAEVSGRDFLLAYAAGFEAGVRTGQASPGHRKGGWHLTGTLGAIAAGAAAGKLLGLEPRQLTHALGTSATQAAGMQQNRGTMCKSLHAGKAASSGLLAALLAQRGFDSSEEIIEGRRGFSRIYSDVATPELALEQLGERWEIARNGHKPYACGVLLHPTIDAMIELGRKAEIAPGDVASIELRVHPDAVTITGIAEPKSGLQSKFSIGHTAAVAFIDGAAGIAQYSDARAASADVTALRTKVTTTIDESFSDQAEAVVTGAGKRLETRVEHATGTVDNPISDRAIEEKFRQNAIPVIGEARADRICALVWGLDGVRDMREVVAECR